MYLVAGTSAMQYVLLTPTRMLRAILVVVLLHVAATKCELNRRTANADLADWQPHAAFADHFVHDCRNLFAVHRDNMLPFFGLYVPTEGQVFTNEQDALAGMHARCEESSSYQDLPSSYY